MFGIPPYPHNSPKEPSKFDPKTLNATSPVPDLRTQLESLFDTVWRSEGTWRMMDRIDQQVAIDERRKKNGGRSKETSAEADAERKREETDEGSTDNEEGPRD